MIYLLFALACLGGAELGHAILVPLGGGTTPIIWFPSGFLVAALILQERARWWVWLTIGFVISAVDLAVHGTPLPTALGIALMSCAGATLTAAFVGRFSDPPFSLKRVGNASALMIGALVASGIAALPVAGLLLSAGVPFALGWRGWWLADGIGILAGAPLILAFAAGFNRMLNEWRSWRGLETVLAIGGLITATQLIFGDTVSPLVRVPSFLLPFLLWPAMRLGPGGSAVAVIATCGVAIWHTANGRGPFMMAGNSPADLLVRGQGSMAMVAVTLTLLSSVVAERREVLRERARLIGELQKALTEIRTLRGFIPMCAWCHKVRDDEGFWQGLETYLDAKTDATVSHSICPSCAKTQHDELTAETEVPEPEWRL